MHYIHSLFDFLGEADSGFLFPSCPFYIPIFSFLNTYVNKFLSVSQGKFGADLVHNFLLLVALESGFCVNTQEQVFV
jgi:hypothetical protein